MISNLDYFLESVGKTRSVSVPPHLSIIIVGDPVDPETGEAADLVASDLMGLNLLEAAEFVQSNFAGDTVFILEMASGFVIVRPAFSELPLYYRQNTDGIEIWSDRVIPDLLSRAPVGFDIGYLSLAMHNWSLVSPRTGLLGVSELLSGAMLIYDGNRPVQKDFLVQSALDLEFDAQTDYDYQVAQIRSLILNSIKHKIGSKLDRTCIQCSGGVDSSVVAVGAKFLYPAQTLPLIHCYSENDPHGDERFYFQTVANRLSWPSNLVDMYIGSSNLNLTPDLLLKTVRPVKSAAALSTMATLKGLALKNNADTMLAGDGGDQLFILNNPLLYTREIVGEASDLVEKFRRCNDLAIMGRETIWSVASEMWNGARSEGLRERFFGPLRFPHNQLARIPPPENAQVIPEGDKLKHFETSRAFQFFGMRNAELNHIPVKGYEVEERKTFVFWPLIRAALAAKRMFHLKDGRDRAMERDAFRSELPPEVYNRHSKGGSRDFVERYDFEALIANLRTGPLSRHGLLSTRINEIDAADVDSDLAHSLVVAQGLSDWMELHEQRQENFSSDSARNTLERTFTT
ncbi:asparagine synthase-related protein [Rhizobium rhizogenes]|uniref:asparagine synthase-related protein n=1 Tax=Rhizobium rhizogenes TaxID=359 RepID=UPI0022C9B6E8|nr:asparagine synthase-related protein [Rhizobium rhizogenes]MCZ7486112.1 asparagine synthase-related protein [Rhizobium rhizogenes]